MKKENSKILILAACLLLLCGYAGSYFILVKPENMPWNTGVVPRYKIGKEIPEIFFMPIHLLDRKLIRPNYWENE